jgi:hypothetical protein
MRTTQRYLGGRWLCPTAQHPEVPSRAGRWIAPRVGVSRIPDFGFDVEAVRQAVRHSMRTTGHGPSKEVFAALGFVPGGAGISKTAYLHTTAPWVVKVPNNVSGWRETMAERAFYRALTPDQRQFFPASYYIDRFMLVQEKLPPDNERTWRDDSRRFQFTVVQYIAQQFGITDLHEGNVGLGANGRWAFIDYTPYQGRDYPSPALTEAVRRTYAHVSGRHWRHGWD